MKQETAEIPTKNIEKKSRRQPIVVVLGHIDHGKTTLLDRIREAETAAGESGGITQHIGAYEVEVKTKGGDTGKITFIDTPGHEAFSKMRSRGARVADVALLVVAADDGVKPQTEDAIAAIREAGVPFVVVLNKIDKESADAERVKKELGEHEIYLEEWGGKTPLVKVSAKTGEGVPELLEMVLLVSDLGELEADFSKPASGVVIESHLDSRRGNAATLLLRDGTLKKGNFILASSAGVKSRIMEDFKGGNIDEVKAGSSVRVVGFDKVPPVGITFEVFVEKNDFEKAKKEAGEGASNGTRRALEEGKTNFPLVLKADVGGSLEALESEIKKLETPEVPFVILRREVGNIAEDDVKLASSGKEAVVVGFRVKRDKGVSELSERFGVKVMTFDVIYELADWLKTEVERRLPEEKIRTVLGKAKILKIFKKDGQKQIVGGRVLTGEVRNKARFTLLRRDFPLSEGRILELQQQKMKVNEVREGDEFGALAEAEHELVPGDVLEIFEEKTQRKTLNV